VRYKGISHQRPSALGADQFCYAIVCEKDTPPITLTVGLDDRSDNRPAVADERVGNGRGSIGEAAVPIVD
jgi:hypothetical protein